MLELQETWGSEWLKRYAEEILQAAPEGSIYFGGTDAGRCAVSCYSESHVGGRPILTLTQNALADTSYLNYLNSMYGSRMSVPTPADSQQAFQQYMTAAQKRLQQDALLPGEQVQMNAGRVQVSGQTAVMQINGLLVLKTLEKNPGRDFYLEESFAVQMLNPHMEPCGPIFRLHREAREGLGKGLIQANHLYWTDFLQEIFGERVASITNLDAVLLYLDGNHDSDFQSGEAPSSLLKSVEARKAFAKLRGNQADWYAWAAQHTTTSEEGRETTEAAELAFVQAIIIYPKNELTTFPILKGYLEFLRSRGREKDVARIEQVFSDRVPKGD